MSLWDRFMDSGCFVPIFALLSLVAIICGLFLVLFSLESSSCKQFAEVNHLEYQFQLPIGCLVKYQNTWISPDNIRVVPQ